METQIATATETQMAKDIERIEGKLDRLLEVLQGTNGLIVRVDRVEQWQKQATWVIALIASAVILGGIAFVWDLVTHGLTIVKP